MALCAPWITEEDVTLCAAGDFVEGMLAEATVAASELLYAASGRQFHGICTDVIHPCGGGCSVQWLDYPAGYTPGSRPLPLHGWQRRWGDVGVDGSTLHCGAQQYNAVRLPNTPVVDVTEVLIDNATVDPDEWLIVNDGWLLRKTGEWPCCADLRDLTSFRVTYRWGAAVPRSGRMGAQLLACELAKGWSGKDCRLPRRLTQLVREGVTQVVLDPFEFLEEGKFGIWEVDVFVARFNPEGLQRPAKGISPGLAAERPHRIR